MMLKVLSEMVEISEAEFAGGGGSFTSAVKAGWDAAKANRDKIQSANKGAVEKSKAAREAAAGKLSTQQMADIKAEMNEFLKNFFKRFPDHELDMDAVRAQLKTRPQAVVVFNVYKTLANRVEALTKAMNTALVAQKKINKQAMDKIVNDGAAYLRKNGAPPAELQAFVRRESDFFIRLIQVNNDLTLDEPDFTSLLGRKISLTAPVRQPDAVQALNILLPFMVGVLRDQASQIADIGKKLPDEDPDAPDADDKADAAKKAAPPPGTAQGKWGQQNTANSSVPANAQPSPAVPPATP